MISCVCACVYASYINAENDIDECVSTKYIVWIGWYDHHTHTAHHNWATSTVQSRDIFWGFNLIFFALFFSLYLYLMFVQTMNFCEWRKHIAKQTSCFDFYGYEFDFSTFFYISLNPNLLKRIKECAYRTKESKCLEISFLACLFFNSNSPKSFIKH